MNPEAVWSFSGKKSVSKTAPRRTSRFRLMLAEQRKNVENFRVADLSHFFMKLNDLKSELA